MPSLCFLRLCPQCGCRRLRALGGGKTTFWWDRGDSWGTACGSSCARAKAAGWGCGGPRQHWGKKGGPSLETLPEESGEQQVPRGPHYTLTLALPCCGPFLFILGPHLAPLSTHSLRTGMCARIVRCGDRTYVGHGLGVHPHHPGPPSVLPTSPLQVQHPPARARCPRRPGFFGGVLWP